MNADRIRPIGRIGGRGMALPGFAFLEGLVAVQATLGTFAGRSRHKLDGRAFCGLNQRL